MIGDSAVYARPVDIPKLILHPALLIAGALSMLCAFWLKSPSASAIKEKLKTAAPSEKYLFQILDILPGGGVVLDDKEGVWLLDDARFQEIETDKLSRLHDFFVGKFIDVPANATAQKLSFPLELYDPRCFAADKDMQNEATMCPLIIEK